MGGSGLVGVDPGLVGSGRSCGDPCWAIASGCRGGMGIGMGMGKGMVQGAATLLGGGSPSLPRLLGQQLAREPRSGER